MVAYMNILLLLSLDPINAMRVMEAQKAVDLMNDSQDLMKELHRALEEDALGVGEEEGSESQTTCTAMKGDFEDKTRALRIRYDSAKAEGKIGTYDAARIMLRARSATKALSAAQKQECTWVVEKNVDKSHLEALVAETAGTNPCFGAAKAHLEGAKKSSAADQAAALTGAMGILLSKDCKPVKGAAASRAQVATAEAQAVGDEEAAKLKAVPRPKLTRGVASRHLALLQEEGFNSSEISALLNATKGDSASAVEGALMEMVSQVHTDSGDLLDAVFGVLGWICLVILWCMFCWVILAVMMLILGLIACIFKLIIVGFLRVFGSKSWNFDYGGCVGFWLGALGHDNHAGDVGIGFCALSMMTR